MSDASQKLADRRRTLWTVPAATILATACTLQLLRELVFHGWAHSYDSAIYVRSLWGIAQGNFHNPWVDLHVLSVHGNLILFLLAPFTALAHPAIVLIWAQSLSLGATVCMVVIEFRRLAIEARMDRASIIAAGAFAAFAITVGAPMVANPFLFDIRPDLIGIPFLLFGLLRARRLGRFDTIALGVMLLSLTVREEYMMVIFGAMAATPFPRKLSAEWKLRLIGASIALGYFALYWFGFRSWIGDGSDQIAADVSVSFLEEAELSQLQILGYKIEIVAVFLASVGGLSLLGWRWIASALPGLLLLLISSRLQHLVLNFHYAMFVIPGVLVASVDGFERWLQMRDHRLVMPVMSASLISLVFVFSSAVPGGGRFRAENFFLLEPEQVEQRPELEAVYDLVHQIPHDTGIAVPHELAAPIADRALGISIHEYLDQVTETSVPVGVDWILLPGNRWANVGRMLVDLHGFRLVDFHGTRLALLTRDASVRASWPALITTENPASCREPIARWPLAGFSLCAIEPREDGRLRVTVIRNEGPDDRLLLRPLALMVRPGGTESFAPAFMLRGLVNPSQIPTGGSGVFVTDAPVVRGASGSVDIMLAFTEGGAIPVDVPGLDEPVGAVSVRW